jgi:hypothetical protein
VAAAIGEDQRETSDVEQQFAIKVMDHQLDVLSASDGDESKLWGDVIVNLAKKGVTLP